MPTELKTLEEYKNAINDAGDKLVVIDFFATWCGPCVTLGPQFETISTEQADDALYYKVDVDQNKDASQDASIRCMPTMIYFKNGEEVERQEGTSADAIKEAIAKHK